MKRLLCVAAAAVTFLLPASRALAAPVQIDFNVAGFGPTDEAHQSFTKNLLGLPSLTFESLGLFLQPQGHLHWDADDGQGNADGFGVRDFPDLFQGNNFPDLDRTYSQDEIEFNERLSLTFSTPVSLLSFNLTDLFFENESTLSGFPLCLASGQLDCYIERGQYSIDGGSNWVNFFADPTQERGNLTNGTKTVSVNQVTSSLLLRAPGALDVIDFRYRQLHDFSLAGVQIDPVATPEPTTMVLLGTGMVGLVARRLRRRK